jgi:hypothetical protein
MGSSRFCFIYIFLISTSNLGSKTGYLIWVPQSKERDSFSNYVAFVPFGILFKSLFTNDPNIRHYLARDIDSFIKGITNQYNFQY